MFQDIILGCLQMPFYGLLHSYRILSLDAFEDASVSHDGLKDVLFHKYAFYPVPEHVPAQELTQLLQAFTAACAGKDLMEFGVQIHE